MDKSISYYFCFVLTFFMLVSVSYPVSGASEPYIRILSPGENTLFPLGHIILIMGKAESVKKINVYFEIDGKKFQKKMNAVKVVNNEWRTALLVPAVDGYKKIGLNICAVDADNDSIKAEKVKIYRSGLKPEININMPAADKIENREVTISGTAIGTYKINLYMNSDKEPAAVVKVGEDGNWETEVSIGNEIIEKDLKAIFWASIPGRSDIKTKQIEITRLKPPFILINSPENKKEVYPGDKILFTGSSYRIKNLIIYLKSKTSGNIIEKDTVKVKKNGEWEKRFNIPESKAYNNEELTVTVKDKDNDNISAELQVIKLAEPEKAEITGININKTDNNKVQIEVVIKNKTEKKWLKHLSYKKGHYISFIVLLYYNDRTTKNHYEYLDQKYIELTYNSSEKLIFLKDSLESGKTIFMASVYPEVEVINENSKPLFEKTLEISRSDLFPELTINKPETNETESQKFNVSGTSKGIDKVTIFTSIDSGPAGMAKPDKNGFWEKKILIRKKPIDKDSAIKIWAEGRGLKTDIIRVTRIKSPYITIEVQNNKKEFYPGDTVLLTGTAYKIKKININLKNKKEKSVKVDKSGKWESEITLSSDSTPVKEKIYITVYDSENKSVSTETEIYKLPDPWDAEIIDIEIKHAKVGKPGKITATIRNKTPKNWLDKFPKKKSTFIIVLFCRENSNKDSAYTYLDEKHISLKYNSKKKVVFRKDTFNAGKTSFLVIVYPFTEVDKNTKSFDEKIKDIVLE